VSAPSVALRTAKNIARAILQRAAAGHTNAARELVSQAQTASSQATRNEFLERGLATYRKAAKVWRKLPPLDGDHPEKAYESRFWLAHALANIVLVQLQLGRAPSPGEVDRAKNAARDARDSIEDDKFTAPAGLLVVKVARGLVQAQYQQFAESNGAKGIEEFKSLKTEGEGENRKHVTLPIPADVQRLMAAWDEYVRYVPPRLDRQNHGSKFAYQAGDTAFLYGHFAAARKRLTLIFNRPCTYGDSHEYMAWIKLMTMANLEGDTAQGRALAEQSMRRRCPPPDPPPDPLGPPPTGFPSAYRAFLEAEKAEKTGNVPERQRAWYRVATLYEAGLKKAPAADDAPEAAMNGAHGYKQLGQYDKAIALYQLFIRSYGNQQLLSKLENGQPHPTSPAAPQPERYAERIKYLKLAYDALAISQVLLLDYRAAAATFETITRQVHFQVADRRKAALNAVILYANNGDEKKMQAVRKVFLSLKPLPKQKMEFDWWITAKDLKAWDEHSPDRGTNRKARLEAVASLQRFYRISSRVASGSEFPVRAAYYIAKLKRAGSDEQHRGWCKRAISAFNRYKKASHTSDRNKALGSEPADMAAECDYRAVDEAISRAFDYRKLPRRYQGAYTDVIRQYQNDVNKDAKGWFAKLQAIMVRYQSLRWTTAARARQGSLYDTCRSWLTNAREPELKLLSAADEKALARQGPHCKKTVIGKPCKLRQELVAKRRQTWQLTRKKLLPLAERPMVPGYTDAILWSRAWKVRPQAVVRAIKRLAFYTPILGNGKLRSYTAGIIDPATGDPLPYQNGMFLTMRPGMVLETPSELLSAPLPLLLR